MRKRYPAIGVLVMALAAYAVWPAMGFAQLAQAVHSRDADNALRRIDVVSVRRSILTQVLDESTRGGKIDRAYGQLGRSIAVGFVQTAIERRFSDLMNADAVRNLVASGRLPGSLDAELGGDGGAVDAQGLSMSGVPESPFRVVQGLRIRSPITVDFTLGAAGRERDWTTFRLRRSGLTWKLTAVELPDAMIDRLKPIVRQRLAEVGL